MHSVHACVCLCVRLRACVCVYVCVCMRAGCAWHSRLNQSAQTAEGGAVYLLNVCKCVSLIPRKKS